MTLEQLFKFYIEFGIISISDVMSSTEDIIMNKILKKVHPYEIYFSESDNRWHTYIKDDLKLSGRKQLVRKERRDLEKALLKHYHLKIEYTDANSNTKRKRFANDITVVEFFPHWIEYKKQNPKLSSETIDRYGTDFKRFIKNSEFGKMQLREIDEIDIEEFVVSEIERLNLKTSAVKNLVGYINQMFQYARRSRIVDANPFDLVDCKNNVYPYCYSSSKSKEERTLTDYEMKLLRSNLHRQQEKHPLYMPNYAIEICTWSGLRVGEVVALKWDAIINGELNITQSEHRIAHENSPDTYEIGLTKNKKERRVPIGTELEELLNRIKKLQEENGVISDYIIADVNGRVIAPNVSKAMYRRACEVGLKAKSIHGIRRTVASKLYQKYPKPTVAYIMGIQRKFLMRIMHMIWFHLKTSKAQWIACMVMLHRKVFKSIQDF